MKPSNESYISLLNDFPKVAVLGCGIEGKSTVKFLQRHYVKDITIFDRRVEAQTIPEVTVGEYGQLDLNHFDLIFRTPSFNPNHSALQGIDPLKIVSQTNLFLQQFAAQTIGITGTKGKGTTSSLLHDMLKLSGKRVHLAGNIGVPFLDIIDQVGPQDVVVAELSSYQLWDAMYSPHMAIGLMIVPEHLELHGRLSNYLQAKSQLFQHQTIDDIAIFNNDFSLTRQIVSTSAQRFAMSGKAVEQGIHYAADSLEITNKHRSVSIALPQMSLLGKHNLQNIAAAAMAAHLNQVNDSTIVQAISQYRPLPHRLESVASINGIEYIDDSISTTPESTLAAVQAFDKPVVLLLGGQNRHANWAAVLKDLSQCQHLKAIVVMGQDSDSIHGAAETIGITIPMVYDQADIAKAVSKARVILQQHASTGIVLLSPGAKSFDMFSDYKHRGQVFKQAAILQV